MPDNSLVPDQTGYARRCNCKVNAKEPGLRKAFQASNFARWTDKSDYPATAEPALMAVAGVSQ